MLKYHHLGIPTDKLCEGEKYLEKYGMFVSGYEESPYNIEWMRFEPGSTVHELIQSIPHVAFEVDDLAAALEGHDILIEPNSPSEGVTVAFVLCDGAPVEFLEFTKK